MVGVSSPHKLGSESKKGRVPATGYLSETQPYQPDLSTCTSPSNIVPFPKTVPPSGIQTLNDRTAGRHLMLKDEYFSSLIKKLHKYSFHY